MTAEKGVSPEARPGQPLKMLHGSTTASLSRRSASGMAPLTSASGARTRARRVQPEKEPSLKLLPLMEVRDAGRTRASRPVQLRNAPMWMDCRHSGRSRLTMPEHLRKALWPIDSTRSGMHREVMPVQEWNASSPIDRRLAGSSL